jgi:hypothetical protein
MGRPAVPSSNVSVFQQYPFERGQRIRIDGGPRAGDWEVIDVGERKISLKCPVSGREVEWDRFCFFVEERENQQWPQKD